MWVLTILVLFMSVNHVLNNQILSNAVTWKMIELQVDRDV